MKTSSHFTQFGYHTWKDIGGVLGLFLDILFCAFVLVAAFFMMIVAIGLLVLDYLFTPILALISRIHLKHST